MTPASSPGEPLAPARRDRFRSARRRVLGLLDARPPLLVVSDFDGTLAPIDPDPMGARIEPLGRSSLRRLARLSRIRPDLLRVVVLSGRASVDVASRVRVGGLAYLGNHGLEIGHLPVRGRPEALTVTFDRRLRPFEATVGRLGDAVREQLGRPDWLFVEVKGPSVAFHFRQAPDGAAALARIDQALAAVEASLEPHGLERFEGRRVVEFRPAGAGGKGAAVGRLIRRIGPGAILVLGDDRSDAEAFRVVAEVRATGQLDGLSVAVHGRHETPGEVVETADLMLETPRDAARLLSALAGEVERRIG